MVVTQLVELSLPSQRDADRIQSNLTLYHFWKQKLFLEQNFTFEAKVLWKVPILGGEVDHLPVYRLPPDRCLDES